MLQNTFSFCDVNISPEKTQTPEKINEDPADRYSDSRSEQDFDMMDSMGPNALVDLLAQT
jgi:hypothetical protein